MIFKFRSSVVFSKILKRDTLDANQFQIVEIYSLCNF